jgi:hypothetical protein
MKKISLLEDNSPQSAVLGASGEYLVLSHLLRLNFVAGKAPDNTKDYDLIILNKDGTSSSPIQVKTTFKEMHWLLQEKHENPIKNLIFCFVYMSKDCHKNEIFVIDSKVVAYAISTAHKIWLKLPGLKGRKHNDSKMRALHRDYNFFTKLKNYKEYLNKEEIKFIDDYSLGWMDKYKEAWHLIDGK